MTLRRGTPLERFLSRLSVNPETACWEIGGYRSPIGQVVIYVGTKSELVSRFAYKHFVGPIPDGFLVCHHCDRPYCGNPDHLFLGTAKDNQQDMSQKGRWNNQLHRRTHCVNRHRLSKENTRTIVNRNGGNTRICRACARVRVSRYRQRQLQQKEAA